MGNITAIEKNWKYDLNDNIKYIYILNKKLSLPRTIPPNKELQVGLSFLSFNFLLLFVIITFYNLTYPNLLLYDWLTHL